MRPALTALPLALSLLLLPAPAPRAGDALPWPTLEAWGEALFFDTNLSANRSQSCATCHDPAHAFTDPRESAAGRMVSLGDDGHSLGDRNAPTAMYAALTPAFHRDPAGEWLGGLFLDGRARTLADQAVQPFLNPAEMGMPDGAAVVARLREDPRHAATLALLAPGADAGAAFARVGEALAAFERTPQFAPFDSRYDRYLRGEATLTDQEELGRLLFFSDQFTNCHLCHQLQPLPGAEGETFTNYRYRNIGVPANRMVRELNGSPSGRVDAGLGDPAAPGAGIAATDGRFKVPTLRNVAVTGPYMHNGVFADLRTVVAFYNKFNSHSVAAGVNPETGRPWEPPEVAANLATEELEHGPALDDLRTDAIVAFLKTLTDRRYEPLLND